MFENFRERDIKSVSINNDKLLPFVKAKPWYDRYLFLEFFEKKMYMTFLNGTKISGCQKIQRNKQI